MMERIKALCIKYKEYILYLIFGGLTTLVSWGVFYVCATLIGMDVVPANAVSWVMAVAFAYVTNRKWVFDSRASGTKAIVREILEFAAGRVITGIIETAALWLTVDIFGFNEMLMKIIVSIIVVVLNYIFSKFIIFRNDGKSNE